MMSAKAICALGCKCSSGCSTNTICPRSAASNATGNGNAPAVGQENAEARIRRLNPIKRKQMEQRSREIEEDIARVEAAIAICESSLLNYVNAEETRRQNLDLEKYRGELMQLMAEWEEIGQALEAG